MGMSRKLQRDARRNAHRNIRLVRQQNDRRIVGDFCQGRIEIIDADARDRPEVERRKTDAPVASQSLQIRDDVGKFISAQ